MAKAMIAEGVKVFDRAALGNVQIGFVRRTECGDRKIYLACCRPGTSDTVCFPVLADGRISNHGEVFSPMRAVEIIDRVDLGIDTKLDWTEERVEV